MRKTTRVGALTLALGFALLLAVSGHAEDVLAMQEAMIADYMTALVDMALLPANAVLPEPYDMTLYDYEPRPAVGYDFNDYMSLWISSDPETDAVDYTLDLLLAEAPEDLPMDDVYAAFILAFCRDEVTTTEEALAIIQALEENSVEDDGFTDAQWQQGSYVYSWTRSHTDSEVPFTIQTLLQ